MVGILDYPHHVDPDTGKFVFDETGTSSIEVARTGGGGGGRKPNVYKGVTNVQQVKKLISPDVEQAKYQQQQQEVEQLKKTTTEREKDIMKLQYAIQQGILSPAVEEKAKRQQQEIMQTLPTKSPTKTAFEMGGKTFIGTYGLSRTQQKTTSPAPLQQFDSSVFDTKEPELNLLAPERKPGFQESSLPSYANNYSFFYKPTGNLSIDKASAPERKPGFQESKKPEDSYSFTARYEPFDTSKAKTVDISPDVSKVSEYYGKDVNWDNIREFDKAVQESNLPLFRQMTIGQTKSKKQMSDLRILEDVESRTQSFRDVEKAKKLVTVGTTFIGVGAAGHILGSVGTAGKAGQLVRIGGTALKGLWGGSLAVRGARNVGYISEGQVERGVYGLAGLGAEVGGVALAGKWLAATEGKPLTRLYKDTLGKAYQRFRSPYFEAKTSQWQKGLTGDSYVLGKGGYTYKTEKPLKKWEDVLIKSPFISESQKIRIMETGDYVIKTPILKGSYKGPKQKDFFQSIFKGKAFGDRVYVEYSNLGRPYYRVRTDKLALPSQPTQTSLGFNRFYTEPAPKVDLKLSEATRIEAAKLSNQWLVKWTKVPDKTFNLIPKGKVGVSYIKLVKSKQTSLLDVFYTPPKTAMAETVTSKTHPFLKVFTGKRGESSVVPDTRPVYDMLKTKTYRLKKDSPFDKNRFSNLFNKGGENVLVTNKFDNIGKTATGKKSYPVFIWEVYPSDFKGIPTTLQKEKVEEKAIIGLESFQGQSLYQGSLSSQKQNLGLESITKLDISQIQAQKQLQRQKQVQKQEQALDTIQITKTSQRLSTRQATGLKQLLDTSQIPLVKTDTSLVTETKKVPDADPVPEPPETPPPGDFNLFWPSSKNKFMPDINLGRLQLSRRKRETDVTPLSDLLSVNITEMFSGGEKATHPRITEEEKSLFDLGVKRGSQYFPTVEMRTGRLPRVSSVFGTSKRKHKKSKKRGEWVLDLL